MEFAISIPDATACEVERRARELGVSRSEFYDCAAQMFIAKLEARSLTARVNEVLERIEPDNSSEFAVWVGRTTLCASDGEGLLGL